LWRASSMTWVAWKNLWVGALDDVHELAAREHRALLAVHRADSRQAANPPVELHALRLGQPLPEGEP